LDLRAGARTTSLTCNLFVNNVANKRGIVGWGTVGGGSGYFANYIQPRTVGLTVTQSF
jgi:hypothetical protein